MTFMRLSTLLRLAAVIGVLTLSIGAASAAPAESTAAVNSDQNSYVVIGVQPDNAKPLFVRGTDENGLFVADGWAKPAYFDYPHDGYVVAITQRPSRRPDR